MNQPFSPALIAPNTITRALRLRANCLILCQVNIAKQDLLAQVSATPPDEIFKPFQLSVEISDKRLKSIPQAHNKLEHVMSFQSRCRQLRHLVWEY